MIKNIITTSLLVILLPLALYAQGYLFPDWLVDEFLAQGVPAYVFLDSSNPVQTAQASVRGHTFYWESRFDPDVTIFRVSGTDISFEGTNQAYQNWVVTINWLAYFGTLPGAGFSASNTIVGASVDEMSSIVLIPINERPERQTKEYTDEKAGARKSALFSGGLQYEKANYQEKGFNSFSIPIAYFKEEQFRGRLMNIGAQGNLRYSSFEDAKKYSLSVSPYFKTEYNDNLVIGGIINSAFTVTSIENGTVPTVNVIGIGGFASYYKYYEEYMLAGGLLIEPKYGDGSFGLPVVIGVKALLPLSIMYTIKIDYVTGFDSISETDEDQFSKISLNLDLLGGIYSTGYQKLLGSNTYSNNIFYVNYRTMF